MIVKFSRRARAQRTYSRASCSAMPRLLAGPGCLGGRIQAWRENDGVVAQPVYPAAAAVELAA
jgi:hypothetical protein